MSLSGNSVRLPPYDVKWPLLGVNRRLGFQSQPPYTCPDALNVRNDDVFERRLRGGSRPGLVQVLPPKAAVTPSTTTSTVDFSAEKDAYIYVTSPGTNYGTNTLLSVGLALADVNTRKRSVVHFNLNNIPASATITTAILNLYSPTDMGTPPHPAMVYRFTNASWVETTITWTSDNASFTTTTPVGVAWNTYLIDGTTGVLPSNIDIATLAQDAYDNRSKQLHIMLKVDDETGAVANGQHFRSRDASQASEKPKLTVTYTVPA